MRFGVERYQAIAAGWELGEALYFALFSPNEAAAIIRRTAGQLREKGQVSLEVMADVERATSDALQGVDLSTYHLVGMSAGALQLGASVYLARLLKQRQPTLRIVIGGGNVLGEAGASLLGCVPSIDVIVDGEGEEALAALAGLSSWDQRSLDLIPNIRYRSADGRVTATRIRVLASLDATPPPDMDEFYVAARRAEYSRSDLILPVEASRGCAWEHRGGDGKLRGCTFCGLYRNSPNFREKKLETVLAEIRSGVSRTQALDVSFVDAYLPPSYTKELLRELVRANLDVTLFCEMRCDFDAETADLLARAGARHVQLGVEAFHSRILARMAKGTRMIDNVSCLKLCHEFGVVYQYNLISRFPGVSLNELHEMIELLPLLFGLKPPSVADFYLDRGSRIFQQPEFFGLRPESVDRVPLPFLPSNMALACVNQVVPAEVDSTEEIDHAWHLLEEEVARWRAKHDEARAQGIGHLLTYRDAGTALLVTDHRRDDGYVLELPSLPRAVLLACDRLIHRHDLAARVPDLDEATFEATVHLLARHGLILEESGWLLGLPIRSMLPNGAPRLGSARFQGLEKEAWERLDRGPAAFPSGPRLDDPC
jgi:ribosomal peptide maturation radical SAM protein 1